jgi:hypothetical protein
MTKHIASRVAKRAPIPRWRTNARSIRTHYPMVDLTRAATAAGSNMAVPAPPGTASGSVTSPTSPMAGSVMLQSDLAFSPNARLGSSLALQSPWVAMVGAAVQSTTSGSLPRSLAQQALRQVTGGVAQQLAQHRGEDTALLLGEGTSSSSSGVPASPSMKRSASMMARSRSIREGGHTPSASGHTLSGSTALGSSPSLKRLGSSARTVASSMARTGSMPKIPTSHLSRISSTEGLSQQGGGVTPGRLSRQTSTLGPADATGRVLQPLGRGVGWGWGCKNLCLNNYSYNSAML